MGTAEARSDGSGLLSRLLGDEEDVSGEAASAAAATEMEGSDDSTLKRLGYKQELSRSLSAISNFAVTFSIVSLMTGITTLYNTGLEFGGPLTMVYGWPIAGTLTLIVGLSMSEICSAYPTAGGLYYWSAKLCGRK